jgi:hypothetical protein
MPLSWPFAQCGLDMVGKLHKSWPEGHVYMLVAVNKFHQVYFLSLRSTTQHNHRQWYKFHVKGVQGLLRKIGNQIEICICSTSEDKRASRKSQWPNMQRDKETAAGTP